ncbi:Uncharacterised protein [Corynebacterium renale]|nr:Uncharacterised protein [Corynebacterium renale]
MVPQTSLVAKVVDLMATLHITDKKVIVELDWWEKLAAHRSHLTIPSRTVVRATAVDDVFALPEIAEGKREPATRIKGVTSTGTYHQDGDSVFAVCHGSAPKPGIVIELDGATVERIVVSTGTSQQARDYATQLGTLTV